MKCRRMVEKNIVWFGSYGKDKDGHAMFYNGGKDHVEYDENNMPLDPSIANDNNKKAVVRHLSKIDRHDNYAKDLEGVAQSLQQNLSVIRGELWYNVNFGMPLTSSNLSKGILDSYVVDTILDNPYVYSISTFDSLVSNHRYKATFEANTIYGTAYVSSEKIY